MSPEEKETHFELLKQSRDVLALTYSEIFGLDPLVAMQPLAIQVNAQQTSSKEHAPRPGYQSRSRDGYVGKCQLTREAQYPSGWPT